MQSNNLKEEGFTDAGRPAACTELTYGPLRQEQAAVYFCLCAVINQDFYRIA